MPPSPIKRPLAILNVVGLFGDGKERRKESWLAVCLKKRVQRGRRGVLIGGLFYLASGGRALGKVNRLFLFGEKDQGEDFFFVEKERVSLG